MRICYSVNNETGLSEVVISSIDIGYIREAGKWYKEKLQALSGETVNMVVTHDVTLSLRLDIEEVKRIVRGNPFKCRKKEKGGRFL